MIAWPMATPVRLGYAGCIVVARGALAPFLAAALTQLGCGAQSGEVERTWHVDRAHAAGDAGPKDGPDAAPDDADPSSDPTDDSSEPTFADPGCPEIEEPPDSIVCDPLLGSSECGDGYACSPYVDYPSEPCEAERFGTECALAGPGIQGDSCVLDDCAAGFLCVAGNQGTVCAQLCVSPGPNTCPVGLLCGTVDLKGYGVCF